ncbi:unnamed protein product, partial [Coregonus sp. 'balchen']
CDRGNLYGALCSSHILFSCVPAYPVLTLILWSDFSSSPPIVWVHTVRLQPSSLPHSSLKLLNARSSGINTDSTDMTCYRGERARSSAVHWEEQRWDQTEYHHLAPRWLSNLQGRRSSWASLASRGRNNNQYWEQSGGRTGGESGSSRPYALASAGVLLLGEGVEPNHRHRLGWTSLMVAAMNRQHRSERQQCVFVRLFLC